MKISVTVEIYKIDELKKDRHTKPVDSRVVEVEYLEHYDPYAAYSLEAEDERHGKFVWDTECKIEEELLAELGNGYCFGFVW